MKSARKSRPKTEVENVRTGLGVEALKQAFRDNVFYIQGRYPRTATRNDLCMAVAYTVRDRLLQLFITSLDKLLQQDVRAVCYFSALFDIQVQRLHEYKRQHLNMLYAITLYNRLKRDSDADITTRVVIFGGKTAPGYVMAKLIIKLITSVADVVNSDPEVGDRLKVVFFPNFNVQNSQWVYPAADLSEQISTAGKEASGTGNMRFAMNGALTIGTLDGANVEICEEVGADIFFLFGLTAEQVAKRKAEGYRPRDYYEANPHLREALDQLSVGIFSGGDTNLFKPLVDSLLDHDPYMLLADSQSSVDCQDQVDKGFGKSMSATTLRKGVYAFIFSQKGLMAGLGLQGSTITRITPDQ